jgi:ferrous iron transport protein B
VDGIAAVLPGSATLVPAAAHAGEALRLLLHARDDDRFLAGAGPQVRERVAAGRAALAAAGLDREAVEAEARYAFAREVVAAARPVTAPGPHLSERMDRFLTHPVLGPLLFLLIMGTIFQALFTWSAPMMEAIEGATGWAQDLVLGALDEGMLRDLLVDGVLAGVGAVVIFLPQICLLFLFLTILEDVGYLARAAFLVDRVMRGVGLSGRSFVPLMSSFACAIPGIMAARTIESRRDRFVTILVAPFMSCSARLPVYALMIGAFIPAAYGGWALLGMYLLSVVAALLAAWALRKTLFAGEASTYVMELPAYRLPAPRQVLATVYSRGKIFVTQAGTIILAFSIVLWALAYFPRSDTIPAQAQARIEAGEDAELVGAWEASAQVEQSFMGRMGKAIEPTIEPLGFDWRVGVGLVASFAAREVLVSTLGIVYSVGEDADEESVPLRQRLQEARRPDGRPTFTWLTALSLMVFFVLACQCMSTLAVVKRETASWRWPIFMFVYMTIVAYVGSLIVYQGGLALGWGG